MVNDNDTKICFVVIFNHRYDDNIEKLLQLYDQRFSHINFLMPFYDGLRKDVIPVYAGSDIFQGFLAQAFPRLYEESFTHYVFIADDLLLNPAISEKNLLSLLQLDNETAYIKNFTPLSAVKFQEWCHGVKAIAAFSNICYKNAYGNYRKELPSYDQAVELFKKHDVVIDRLSAVNFDGYNGNNFRWSNQLCNEKLISQLYQTVGQQGSASLPYPLVFGYADFCVVPARFLRLFCRFCGIFAAMNLFVEIALPTALLLACEAVKTEKEITLTGCEIWHDYSELFNRYQGKLTALLADIDSNLLYIHPIKLSQWE